MDKTSIQNALRALAPFHLLPKQSLIEVSETSDLLKFNARELIFSEGEASTAGYLLMAGRVAMLKTSPNGKELIIELIPAGSFFGIVAFLDVRPYPLTARAQKESTVLKLPRDAMMPMLARFPEVQKGMMRIITDRMSATQNLARALAHDNVESRVIAILSALVPRAATASQQNLSLEQGIEISVTRQEIADLTGITLETASRAVKNLEKEGLLDASRMGTIFVPSVNALNDKTPTAVG